MSFPRYPAYQDSKLEWAKTLPEHWAAKHLKRNVRLLTEKTDTRECPVGLENLEGWTGRFIQTESDFQGEGVGFEADDILFGKLRPYLAKVWLADRRGEAIGDFHVLRPSECVIPRFIQYQLLTREVVDLVDGSTYGAKMPRASWGFLGCLELPTPPAEEQLAITNFLDRETAKIDTLIAEQHRLIELLQEKRQAVISHAVTKGLNPNAPMKDSGVEWLGEVPENWDVVQVRRITKSHKQGYYSNEGYSEQGINLLRITDIKNDTSIDASESPKVDENSVPNEFLLEEGDFVFARTGGAGSYGFVRELDSPTAFASYLIRFRFAEFIELGFLRLYFLSKLFLEGIASSIHGGVNQNVHAEDIKNQWLSLAPQEEQRAIARQVFSELDRYAILGSIIEDQIRLLNERRSALISAAVTGQIDVRGLTEEVAT